MILMWWPCLQLGTGAQQGTRIRGSVLPLAVSGDQSHHKLHVPNTNEQANSQTPLASVSLTHLLHLTLFFLRRDHKRILCLEDYHGLCCYWSVLFDSLVSVKNVDSPAKRKAGHSVSSLVLIYIQSTVCPVPLYLPEAFPSAPRPGIFSRAYKSFH